MFRRMKGEGGTVAPNEAERWCVVTIQWQKGWGMMEVGQMVTEGTSR